LLSNADDLRNLMTNPKLDYVKAVQTQQRDFDQRNMAAKQTSKVGNLNALIAEAKAVKKLAAETAGTVKTAKIQLAGTRSASGRHKPRPQSDPVNLRYGGPDPRPGGAGRTEG
jgi:hypothetical protein